MNVKEEIVKNSQMLNEVKEHEIKYDFHRIADFRKENLKPAQKNLEKNEKEEIIRDAIEKSSDLKKLFSEYEKDENLLDVLSSIWLAFDQDDEDLIRKYKLNDFQNKELFMKRMSERLKYARRTALEQRTSRPKPEDIIKLRSDTKSPLERREEEERKREEEAKEKEKEKETDEAPDEDPDEEETDEAPEEETPEEEETDEAPEDKPKKRKTGSDLVDTEKYPAPDDITEEMEKEREDLLDKLKQSYESIKDKKGQDTKSLQRNYSSALKSIEKEYNDLIEYAKKQQKGYEDFPTAKTARTASVNAKKAQRRAKTNAEQRILRFERSAMPTAVGRGVMKAGEIARGTKRGIKGAFDRPGIRRAGESIKRGQEIAGSVIEKQREKMTQRKDVRTVENNLGPEKRKEYITLLLNNKEEEAKKIKDQALEMKKTADDIQSSLGQAKRKEYVDLVSQGKKEEAEKIRREAFEKSRGVKKQKSQEQPKPTTDAKSVSLDGRTWTGSGSTRPYSLRTENNLLRYYGKKINELADNPATRDENDDEKVDTKSKEALKIAGTSMGRAGAEEYMKLMKGSASDKQKAVDMLQRAEQEQERTKKEMGIKEQNESLKRTIKFLYS